MYKTSLKTSFNLNWFPARVSKLFGDHWNKSFPSMVLPKYMPNIQLFQVRTLYIESTRSEDIHRDRQAEQVQFVG